MPDYIPRLPVLAVGGHPASKAVRYYDGKVCAGAKILGAMLEDTGRLAYVNDAKASCFGAVFVDCTHDDSRGRRWYEN